MMMYSKVQGEKQGQRSICFVMEWHPDHLIGGSEIQAWLLAQTLAQRGWRVHYVSEYEDPPKPGAMDHGVHIHGLKIRKTLKKVQLDAFRYPAFSKLLKEIDSDIYYQRFAHPYTGMIALFAKAHHKRFVWASAHELDFQKNAFTYPLDQYHGSLFAKMGLLLIGTLNDRLYGYGIRNADKVLVQAEDHQRLLKDRFGKDSVVIKNGHPVPSRLEPKDDPPIVLWLASLKRWKRAETFVELAKRCEGLDCRFIVAGQASDKGYLDEVLKPMQGLSNIDYVGGVTFEESNDWIGRSSVFVNTSDYEGFPNTFIQAWLRRVPVVSLNVDPDDVLSREKIGFRSTTFENLCRDVSTLIEDKPLRETMGQRARSYAIQNHSLESITDRFLECIRSIL
jgi:glycosyltransferase involved in cell wall biosynthesis